MNRFIIIRNPKNTESTPIKARYCESFISRLRGYTFRHQIEPGEGLVLVENHESRLDTAIHMLFVWTDLAVFWIDSNHVVVDRVLAKSWRPAYIPRKAAQFVLEVHPDRIREFEIGDQLRFENE
jgi:uncharacterized membrane protein (UPF0127 family)